MPTTLPTSRPSFRQFYKAVFLPEHRQPVNIALHVFGTLASGAWVGWAMVTHTWWALVLYPVIHAAPGLLGHRLLERSAALGDVRVTRTDFPPWWFIAGNHVMTWDVLCGRWPARRPAV